MSREIGIVGDIHGNLDALESIVEAAIKRTEKLVFVGDYINRGKQSAQVIDFLIGLSKQLTEPVFLRGNHETAFMEYLAGGPIADFLIVGGAATLKSYMKPEKAQISMDRRSLVPDSHVRFLKGLRDYYRIEDLVVTHSPNDPLPAELTRASSCTFRVAGHLPQSSLLPRITDEAALIDTGSGMWANGCLTCLFWPGKDWIQTGRGLDPGVTQT